MLKIDLTGYRALVCGASGGIGAETAKALAASGAQVVALARNEARLQQLVKSLPGGGHQVLVADLSQPNSWLNPLQAILKTGGPIEILICNAGGPKGGPLIQAEPQEFLANFQTHVLANQILAQTLVPGMRERQYGRIINVISTSVKVPIVNLGVSNTIRAAVASWAKTLANELAADGITVNNVLPGFTETDRLASLAQAAAERTKVSVSQVYENWRATIPAGRFAQASETAASIAFLASPLAAYVNGVNLPVDGGRTGCL